MIYVKSFLFGSGGAVAASVLWIVTAFVLPLCNLRLVMVEVPFGLVILVIAARLVLPASSPVAAERAWATRRNTN